MRSSEEEVIFIAELVCLHLVLSTQLSSVSQVQKGASSARSDDTKSLKGAILDWITPRGQPLNPPLSRNVKIDRGFHHDRTGALLCPAGLDWSNHEFAILYFQTNAVGSSTRLAVPRRICEMGNSLWRAINGLFSYIMDTILMGRILGTGCFAAHSLLQ